MKLYHNEKEIPCKILNSRYHGEFPYNEIEIELEPFNITLFDLAIQMGKLPIIIVEDKKKKEKYKLRNLHNSLFFDKPPIVTIELMRCLEQ